MGGLAGGAEVILLPETSKTLDDVVEEVCAGVRKGKRHSIIVVAEGFVPSDLDESCPSAGRILTDALERDGTVETRLTILGHLQRGGSPTAFDRVLACRFAEAAVRWQAEDRHGVYAGLRNDDIVPTGFDAVEEACANVDLSLLRLAQTVAH